MAKTLYIASEYNGGMRPYAYSILHSVMDEDSYAIIVIKDPKLRDDFKSMNSDRIIFIDYPKHLCSKIFFRFYPTKLIDAINSILKEKDIDLIYTLTGELVLANSFCKFQKRVSIIHTVHDAIHHDVTFNSLIERIKDSVIIRRPNEKLIRLAKNVVTNSNVQHNYLKQKFPDKQCHYLPFPTLVTENIKTGKLKVPELKDKPNNYILFFGNIQLYKGIDKLYDLFVNNPELDNYTLVIAGNGKIYFPHDENKNNIVFINRFVADEELADLFGNAKIVIYPYISATQSGVLSIASYFGKQMILSDIPYFNEIASNKEGIKIINTSDSEVFTNTILECFKSEKNTLKYYDEYYSNKSFFTRIHSIIDATCKSR